MGVCNEPLRMLILIVFFLFLFTSCIGAFVAFDLLVRLEYTFHRDDWEADGKPYGLLWLPPGEKRGFSYAFGDFTLTYRQYKLLFSTRDWIRTDEKALRLLFWFRIFSLMWIVGILFLATMLLTAKSR